MGLVNYIQADFFSAKDGKWLRVFDDSDHSDQLCSEASPLAGPNRYWSGPIDVDVEAIATYNIHYSFSRNSWSTFDMYTYTSKKARIQGTWSIPSAFAPLGFVSIAAPTPPYGIGRTIVTAPAKLCVDLVALVILRQGMPTPLCVACLPQSAAYYDQSWCVTNAATYAALGATFVPIIADNSVEASLADIFYISAVGGAGQYETVITTGLLNARVVTIPVDPQPVDSQTVNTTPPLGGI